MVIRPGDYPSPKDREVADWEVYSEVVGYRACDASCKCGRGLHPIIHSEGFERVEPISVATSK